MDKYILKIKKLCQLVYFCVKYFPILEIALLFMKVYSFRQLFVRVKMLLRWRRIWN